MSPEVSTTARDAAEPRHGRRIFVIWLVLAVIATPVVVFVWGPHLPPGNFSSQAEEQRQTNVLLSGLVTPIILFVLVYFLYAASTFRQRGDTVTDGPPIKGHGRIQAIWITFTAVVVLTAAVWGTIGLFGSVAGAGGGQGPQPLAVPPGKRLPVQVIAQQWGFTYRYPTYGAVETFTLALPVGTQIEMHFTSLDVVHSFWSYELGVKADAVPGADNVAFVKPLHEGGFQIRCSELCGLWHAQMAARGSVLSRQGFVNWIHQQQRSEAPVHGSLPPYATTYFPDPPGRAD